MADMTLSFSAALQVSANNFVVALYANSAPNVLLTTKVPVKPYGNPFQVLFDGLNPELFYIVKLWESETTDPEGLERNSIQLKPSNNTYNIREDLELIGDTSPDFPSLSDRKVYTDSSLLNWLWSLERRATGTLFKSDEYAIDLVDGGFELTDGTEIQEGERYVIHFLPQISQAAPPPPSLISSSITLTNDTVLDNTYVNKQIFLDLFANIITLPALSTVVDFQVIWFSTYSVINSSIRCAGTDKIKRQNEVSKIVLGVNEQLKIYKANGKWQIDYISPGVDAVGQLVYDYANSGSGNIILADGSQYLRAQFERITDYLIANSLMIPQANWLNTDINGDFINKGKYANGDGVTSIQIPLISTYLKPANTIGLAGDFHSISVQSGVSYRIKDLGIFVGIRI